MKMNSPWNKELYSPSSACEVNTYQVLEPEQYEAEIKDLGNFTHSIGLLPYDPEIWLNRAHCLRVLGFPELSLGDAYKARLLVEAALERRSSTLGTKVFQVFAKKIYTQHTQDPAWAPWKAQVSTSALLQARTTDMLKRIEAHIWTELMEGLIACNCCNDYLRMSVAAAEKFPRDDVYPSDVKNAVSWYQQRVTILQAQVDEGDMTPVQMQTTLDNGGVYPTPYPWMTEALLVRDDALLEDVKEEFKATSTNCTVFKSTIRNAPVVGESEETSFDVLGVISTRDITAGETVVKDITPAGVISTIDRCSACCGALPSIVITNNCCSVPYCSIVCSEYALKTYHPSLCGKSLSFLHDAASTAKDTTDFALDALLLLKTLALSIHAKASHPLLTPILHVLTPAYSMPVPQLIIMNFTSHIVTPILTLQALGVDIFTNASYDTWVLHTMRCRIQNNKHGATLEGFVGSAISPLYSMFNHACEPNVDWRHDGEGEGKEGGSSTVTMFATRDIKEGEEMCISYIKGQEMGLEERQKVLKGWLGMECGCARCVEERAEVASSTAGEDGVKAVEETGTEAKLESLNI